MKKKIGPSLGVLVISSVILLSWGATGHRTIGKIAENHLSQRSKAAVEDLLGSETLAEASTWPDEIRNQPEYQHTGSWHYLNLPLGLSYDEFGQRVKGMTEETVYSALLKQEQLLGSTNTSKKEKTEALKYIIHFVGDLHQPMHISRAEDKGGNTIQLNFEGTGTNLHSLWDTKLVERQGLSYEQLAEKYDHVPPLLVKEWQTDPLIKWLWESYEISSRLYAEVDRMKSRSIDDSYYQSHVAIVQERITKAGIRLAGVLNELFKNGLAQSANSPAKGAKSATASPVAAATTSGDGLPQPAPKVIDVRDAAKHMDEYVTVCTKVFGYKPLDNMTLVNLGAAYPDQPLTAVLRGDARESYKGLDGQTICVTGKVVSYKDKPEIVVTDPKMIVAAGKP